MYACIYELRKNCCGTGGREIEGSTRGPRGPKNLIIRVFQNNVLFVNVIVVSLSSGQVNRIVVCGFSNAQATI